MLIWLVLFLAGAISAGTVVVVAAATRGRGDRVTHGPVHRTAALVRHELCEHRSLRRLLHERITPRQLTGVAVALALVALVGVAALAFEVRRDATLVRIDQEIAAWTARRTTAASTAFLRYFTDLGSSAGIAVLGLVVVVVELARSRTLRVIVFLTVTIGVANVATTLLKEWVERARPDIDPVRVIGSFAYPSGHASGAAVAFAAFALCLGRGRARKTRVVLAASAAGLATMVAASRVLIGVHWTSDAVAGLALGWGWFTVCAIAFGGRLLRFGTPVEMAARVEHHASPSSERVAGEDRSTAAFAIVAPPERDASYPVRAESIRRRAAD